MGSSSYPEEPASQVPGGQGPGLSAPSSESVPRAPALGGDSGRKGGRMGQVPLPAGWAKGWSVCRELLCALLFSHTCPTCLGAGRETMWTRFPVTLLTAPLFPTGLTTDTHTARFPPPPSRATLRPSGHCFLSLTFFLCQETAGHWSSGKTNAKVRAGQKAFSWQRTRFRRRES